MTMGIDNRGARKPPLGSQIDWNDLINNGICNWWLFTEGAGQQVFDVGPYKNHGTFAGSPTLAWGTGFQSRYLVGNGLGYVLLSKHIRGPEATDRISLSGWLWTDNITSGGIIEDYDWLAGKGMFAFRQVTTNIQFFLISGTTDFSASGSGITSSLSWHHVAGTYDGATIRVYVNGIQTGSTAAAAKDLLLADTDSPVIMAKGDNQGSPHAGKLSQMRLWSRSLDPQEIVRLYHEPFAGIALPRRRVFPGAAAVAAQTYPRWRQGMHGRGPHWKQGVRYT